jgi:hypothetical protein
MAIDVFLASPQSGLSLELFELGQLVEHDLSVGREILTRAFDPGREDWHRREGSEGRARSRLEAVITNRKRVVGLKTSFLGKTACR